MKSAKILLLLPLALLAGCVTASEQPKSASQSPAAQPRTAFVPVMGSGGSSGLQQFRR